MDETERYQDVLDPFMLAGRVFELDFPSLQIVPSVENGDALLSEAPSTIARLRSNDELSVKARWWYVRDYCASHITPEFLEKDAPFIFRE